MDTMSMAQWDISGANDLSSFGDLRGGGADCGTLLDDLEGRLRSFGFGGEVDEDPRRKGTVGKEAEGGITEFVWRSHNRCHCLPVRELNVSVEGLQEPIRILETVNTEEAMVHYAVMGEEESFGAKLWPMAYVAARRLLREGVRGRSVLELGCGTSFVSLAALKGGAAFTLATDRSSKHLDLAQASARLNGLELHAELFDVATSHPLPSSASPHCGNLKTLPYKPKCADLLPAVFDFVVLSDALYWPEDTVAFARRVAEAYVAGSTVVVADGGRQRGTFLATVRKELRSLGIQPFPELELQAAECPGHVSGKLCSEVRTASSSLFCEQPFELVLRPPVPLARPTVAAGVAAVRQTVGHAAGKPRTLAREPAEFLDSLD